VKCRMRNAESQGRGDVGGSLEPGALPFEGREDLLAQTEGLGGDLQQLVLPEKLQGLFQPHGPLHAAAA